MVATDEQILDVIERAGRSPAWSISWSRTSTRSA
jgi:hypothetical protein